MSDMSTVKKVRDSLSEMTTAAAKAHEEKLARHREHLAKLKREREQREAEMVAQQIEGENA